jgi:hypothetical protein
MGAYLCMVPFISVLNFCMALSQFCLRLQLLIDSLLCFMALFQGSLPLHFELTRGSRPYLQGEIVSPTSFPWGSFGHKVSDRLAQSRFLTEIWVAPRDHVCLFEEIVVLLPHDLSPKGFYPGRDESALEGMVQT